MKILCKLKLHNWSHYTKFVPSINAKIVTHAYEVKQCKRCGLKEEELFFDWSKEKLRFKEK